MLSMLRIIKINTNLLSLNSTLEKLLKHIFHYNFMTIILESKIILSFMTKNYI